jgi:hypothetical protein
MRIQALRNKHKGADVYVVGTGPSMRFFPCDFLKDKIDVIIELKAVSAKAVIPLLKSTDGPYHFMVASFSSKLLKTA